MFEVSKRDIEIISLEILQLYTYPNVSHMVLSRIIIKHSCFMLSQRSLEELEKEISKIKEELAVSLEKSCSSVKINFPVFRRRSKLILKIYN